MFIFINPCFKLQNCKIITGTCLQSHCACRTWADAEYLQHWSRCLRNSECKGPGYLHRILSSYITLMNTCTIPYMTWPAARLYKYLEHSVFRSLVADLFWTAVPCNILYMITEPQDKVEKVTFADYDQYEQEPIPHPTPAEILVAEPIARLNFLPLKKLTFLWNGFHL